MSTTIGNSAIVTCRNAIVTAIATALPDLRDCSAHPGAFDDTELRRFLTLPPAVRVAALAIERFEPVSSGEIDAVVDFAAYVAAPGNVRDVTGDAGLALVTALVELIHHNDWDLDGVDAARLKRADNLYGAAVDGKGVTLWGLSWTQVVRLGSDMFAEDGTVPSTVYVGITPNIGSAHQASYVDVTTGEAPDV